MLIEEKAIELGAYRCACIPVEAVGEDAQAVYAKWVADGKHGDMAYCARYGEQRADPALLLEGANVMVCCAFSYASQAKSPIFADYALIEDYHYHVKDRLMRLGAWIVEQYGGQVRAVVDTAPLRERYWAARSGIGIIGLNNQLIIPGAGSRFSLGFLLWAAPEGAQPLAAIEARRGQNAEAWRAACLQCGACVRACPGGALDGQGGCDARRCASYLTIEHKGPLPPGAKLSPKLVGCDVCQDVCPYNRAAAPLSPFPIDAGIATLTGADLPQMTKSRWRRLTKRSALSRLADPPHARVESGE